MLSALQLLTFYALSFLSRYQVCNEDPFELLAVPFSAVGAIWLLYFLGYNMNIGTWVGLIALMGVDAETGVFMLLYLDPAFEERKRLGLMRNQADLREAIAHGAANRISPKFMTVTCHLRFSD